MGSRSVPAPAGRPFGSTGSIRSVHRIGLVGVGKMGVSHLAIGRAHPRLDFVAVCDSQPFVLAAVLIVTAVHAPVPRVPWLRVLMVVLGAVGLVMSQSLGATVAVAGALAIFGLRSVPTTGMRRSALFTPTRVIVLVIVAAVFAMTLRSENLPVSDEFNQSTTIHRVILAEAGVELFLQHPIFGVGWQRSPEAVQDKELNEQLRSRFGSDVNPEFLPDQSPTGVHNAYVQIATEAGLVGILGFLIFLVACIRGIRALLRRLVDFDLMGTITVPQIGVDDPVWHWLEPRTASDIQTHDNLWLRIIDLPAALALRSYDEECDVVVELDDLAAPWQAGRWRIVVRDGEGSATRTDAEPDLELPISALGSIYLGGTNLVAKQRAGVLAERRPGAIRELWRAFRTDLAPTPAIGF